MKKLTVIDLDGTLYDGSTLKQLYRFAMVKSFKRIDVVTIMQLLWQNLLSLIGIKTHREAKHALMLRLEMVFDEKDFENFAMSLTDKLNNQVLSIMKKKREENHFIVLSTASPEAYCMPLAAMLSFDACHATPTTLRLDDYVENRSRNKTTRLKQLIDTKHLTIDTVLTDHHDDLPLIEMNREGLNIIVNPSKETEGILKLSDLNFRIITSSK